MEQSYGLIGEKLGHSISPIIHKEIFNYINIKGKYDLYEIAKDNFQESFFKLKSMSLYGFNVTIPYKVSIMEYLDDIDSKAAAIGAVNTINVEEEILTGYNTDYDGIRLTFIKNNMCINDKSSVVILGSGGASHAVLQYVMDEGCKDITFLVRDKNRALSTNKVLKKFNLRNYSELNYIDKKEILINSTPCGMYPNINQSPIPIEFLDGFKFVFDLIYNPSKTLLLNYCSKLNIKSANGLYMLVGQAIAAEAIWNRISFSQKDIENIYERILAKYDFTKK